MARKRRRFARWLERAGHRVWSFLLRTVFGVLGWLWGGLSSVLLWLRFRGPITVLALLGAALVAVVLAHRHWPQPSPPTADSDVETLARVIRSEAGISPRIERVHVAWATRNLARSRGQSITEMACSPCGDQGPGRPVSSAQAPLAEDRRMAQAILSSPAVVDPTGGATHFINPRLQERLARNKVPGYRRYRVIRRVWEREYGWNVYYRLSPTLELWGE